MTEICCVSSGPYFLNRGMFSAVNAVTKATRPTSEEATGTGVSSNLSLVCFTIGLYEAFSERTARTGAPLKAVAMDSMWHLIQGVTSRGQAAPTM